MVRKLLTCRTIKLAVKQLGTITANKKEVSEEEVEKRISG